MDIKQWKEEMLWAFNRPNIYNILLYLIKMVNHII